MPLLRTLLVSAVVGAVAPALAAATPVQQVDTTTTRVVARPAATRVDAGPGAARSQDADATAAILTTVAAAGGVPVDDHGEVCADDDVRVRWQPPGITYERGGWIEPLGPAPDAATTAVNGIVACDGSTYALVGVEARVVDGSWQVAIVPSPDHGEAPGHAEAGHPHHAHEHEGEHEVEHEVADEADVPGGDAAADIQAPDGGVDPAPVSLPAAGRVVDDYATYQPQRRCDTTRRPGTHGLRDHLLSRYPGTRSLGIQRACGAGGTSEHKEGRAFDWGVNADVASERRAAEHFLARLLATDGRGNRHALARRMGVMYVIWDRRIWSAYAADVGWRAYGGWSPHRDHVHISLSWDGATGRTSFWSGKAVTGTPGGDPGGKGTGGTGTGGTGTGGTGTGGTGTGGTGTGGKGGSSGGGRSGGGSGGGTGGGGTGGGSSGGGSGSDDGDDTSPDRVGPPPTMTLGVQPTVERVDEDETAVRVPDTSTRARRWRERARRHTTATTTTGVPSRRLPSDRGAAPTTPPGAPPADATPRPGTGEPATEPPDDADDAPPRSRTVGGAVAPPAATRDRWDRVRATP